MPGKKGMTWNKPKSNKIKCSFQITKDDDNFIKKNKKKKSKSEFIYDCFSTGRNEKEKNK